MKSNSKHIRVRPQKGFAKIFDRNEKTYKPAPPLIAQQIKLMQKLVGRASYGGEARLRTLQIECVSANVIRR